MRGAFILISFLLGILSAKAVANDLYNSFVESIDQANSQAHVTFTSGTYITEVGDSKMVWYLDGGNRATIAFKYANRTLQNGSISFFDPLKVEIRAASGLCSIFTVKKLSFETGGALDPDNSDFVLTPPSSGTCNYSKNAVLLEEHLALSSDSGRFFHGRAFVSSDNFKKCKDAKCGSAGIGQPVSKVVFFSKSMPDGTLDAIAVSLRPNATLRLPNNGGWIQIGGGTHAKVSQLSYNLVSESGSAFINEIAINVRAGSIITNDNVLNLEDGSRIALTSIDIEQKPGVTLVKGGDISGALGSQSVLLLSSSAGKKSTATFNKGEVDLKHVRMTYSDNSSSLKAQYAQIKGDIRDAFFYFSERNSLSFSNLSFQVDLKCESAAAECDGVEWSSDGNVKLVGSISPFEANITGGSWSLDTINTLRVTSGDIKAPLLKLDSAAAFFPISGRFSKFELQVDSQDFKLSSDSAVALASVKLRSNDINLSPDESYPYGSMSFDGVINSATFGNIDRVGVANASMNLKLSRKPADTVRIDDGTISASAKVKTSVNDEASASVNLSSIQAYASELTTDFSLGLNSLGTTVQIPSAHKSEKSGGVVDEIELNINLREVPIRVTLAHPFVFSGKLAVKGGNVNIAPINGVPLALDISVPSQELVYVNINKTFPGGSVNLCNPKVNLDGGVNRINGQADFALNNGSVSLNLRNFALQGNISMSAEDRDCKYIAGLVCGAIGSIAGPAGAIGGAYLCTSKVEDAENQASGKINEAIHKTINSYKFTLGQ